MSFSGELDPKVIPTSAPAVPKLVPVFFVNVKTSLDPETIFKKSATNSSLTLATIVNGTVTTVPNDLGLEFELSDIKGYDDLRTNNTIGMARLDCKFYAKTPNGTGVHFTYPGVVHFTDDVLAVLGGKASSCTFEDNYVTNNPKFEFDDTIEEKYKWVAKENFIGKGRFARGEDGALYVQYYTYVLR
ncbi:uncharacterized protein KQ657_002185 [Scheffersomyces spartinae]|uniref:Uncharacterized protein n=1 Tax=Scheffersomyces spartinae TaxID=45513 RepID=A0A9P7VDG0_9ASCO|nr:uncharacterized protein KQ657_002185 [Scheffersomyces spartinae]KAG7195800.1 hypothetical protein KQ657_002185 [Scheffersomyces spartinae]